MASVQASLTQELRATRFELSGDPFDGIQGAVIGTRETIPLVIAHTAPIPQPVRFLVGANASVTALELTGAGESLLHGPVAIGSTTGTSSSAQLRIADVGLDGYGVDIDLRSGENRSGIHINHVGNTGTEHGGLIISSTSNGTGTGIRLGGPMGSGQATLGTGIDITGGTGIRYNALTQGSGTAIEIGGTLAPNRGMTIYVSGSDQVGIMARANTLGTGVIGTSASSAYADTSPLPGTGVFGFAASNSNVTADSVVAVRGRARRGGVGSRGIVTVAVMGDAAAQGTLHSGTAIGVMGRATNSSPGVAEAIGGAFASEVGKLALVAINGDVHLGSRTGDEPPALLRSTLSGSTESSTYLHHAVTSGAMYIRSRRDVVCIHGAVNIIDVADHSMVIVHTGEAGTEIHGMGATDAGRMITLFFVDEGAVLMHDSAQAMEDDRILIAANADLVLPQNGAVTLWYDEGAERWRVVSTSW